jgi:hypothetical protein
MIYSQLTPWYKDLSSKLIVVRVAKKFPVLYNRRTINAVTKARYCTQFWATWSSLHFDSYFCKAHFNIILMVLRSSIWIQLKKLINEPKKVKIVPSVIIGNSKFHWNPSSNFEDKQQGRTDRHDRFRMNHFKHLCKQRSETRRLFER